MCDAPPRRRDAIRLVTLLGSVAFAVAWQTAPGQTGLRTLQVLFLPILFPMLFLVYGKFVVEVGAMSGYSRTPC